MLGSETRSSGDCSGCTCSWYPCCCKRRLNLASTSSGMVTCGQHCGKQCPQPERRPWQCVCITHLGALTEGHPPAHHWQTKHAVVPQTPGVLYRIVMRPPKHRASMLFAADCELKCDPQRGDGCRASAQVFLEECVYRFPQQVEEGGAKKAASASFTRTVGRAQPVVYHVTERAPKPSSPDWRRVVAVFVTGQAWQFKGWPHPARALPSQPLSPGVRRSPGRPVSRLLRTEPCHNSRRSPSPTALGASWPCSRGGRTGHALLPMPIAHVPIAVVCPEVMERHALFVLPAAPCDAIPTMPVAERCTRRISACSNLAIHKVEVGTQETGFSRWQDCGCGRGVGRARRRATWRRRCRACWACTWGSRARTCPPTSGSGTCSRRAAVSLRCSSLSFHAGGMAFR